MADFNFDLQLELTQDLKESEFDFENVQHRYSAITHEDLDRKIFRK